MNRLRTALLLLLAAWMSGAAAPVDLMIGARGFGFGGAYVAVVDDPSAAYWNPAALSRLPSMSLMESNWIFQDVDGLNINYACFAMPVPNIGTVSASWLLKYARLEEGRDAAATRAGENLISLSAGRALWDKLLIFERTSLGFSVNRYTFNSGEQNGAGLGFDAGLWTGLPLGFSLGVTGRNLGADMMGEKVDPELRVGIGYTGVLAGMHRVTVDLDGLYKPNRDYRAAATLEPAANNLKAFGGLEYAVLFGDWEVALRGGCAATRYTTQDSYGYSAGLGVRFLGYSVQYAFKADTEPDATLGYSHRVDLLLQLNRLLVPGAGSKAGT